MVSIIFARNSRSAQQYEKVVLHLALEARANIFEELNSEWPILTPSRPALKIGPRQIPIPRSVKRLCLTKVKK